MAQENRFENERTGVNPGTNVLSTPGDRSRSSVDPETQTISPGSGEHTGRQWSDDMGQSDGMSGRAQDKAHRMADQARDKAADLADQTRSKVGSQLDSQKDRATESLDSISGALRETSGNLRNRHQDSVAQMIDGAAGQMDRLNGYLRDHSVSELLSEAERLARREPAIFIGGAFVLGLLGARFFKSSSPDRDYYGYDRSGGYGGYSGRSYPPRTPGAYRSTDEYRTPGYGGSRTATSGEYGSSVRTSVGQPRGWEAE